MPFHFRLGGYQVSYCVYVLGYFGVEGMGSRLVFRCMRSGGCGLNRESVANCGV